MNSNKLPYARIEPILTPKLLTKQTSEQRFWKKYSPCFLESSAKGMVNAIASSDNDLGLMIFGQGRSVNIVEPSKQSIVRTLTHFDSAVTAIAIRKDGKIMGIAEETGKIEVIDTKEKFHLRNFKNHKKRVNALDYCDNDLYSGGEDMILRLFDVASGMVVHSYENAHDDYIKCVRGLENNNILSGGYDGKIKLFDFRVHE